MSEVCVAMSGGVDSAVAALLLQRAGCHLTGVYGRMFDPAELGLPGEAPRRDAEDAAALARRMGFPLCEADLTEAFRGAVLRPFAQEYRAGRTPNPCVACNRAVKFGALLDWALARGAQTLATGHYARVERDPATGRWLLKRGADRRKDQSYFLSLLTQDQLAHAAFPLGGLEKAQVRRLAEEAGLCAAHRRDSQDICFVPGGDYAGVIERLQGALAPAGDFLDRDGRVLGRHRGLIRYTPGQRRGLGLSAPEPLYVLEKDAASNTVRLGPEEALWSGTLTAEGLNWIAVPALAEPMEVTVKTRSGQHEAQAVLESLPDGRCRAVFARPQRAVAPGQTAVFYQGDTVVGGGTICGR